jgi:RND family efflux transporter MFP subunit
LKELQAAQLAERELRIFSPARGTIGVRYLEAGERVKQEDKILTLIDTESLYAVFPVRESEALLLSRGMKAVVRVDGTGGTYEGIVDLVSPSADSQSFTFSVRVLIPPEAAASSAGLREAGLKPGMFARVSIILGPPRQAVIVPESALFNKKNTEGSVFVVSGNRLSERSVTMGSSLGEDREIGVGVSAGEVVVLRPDTNLREGDYVSVVD